MISLLICWSVLAAAWWVIACVLVWRGVGRGNGQDGPPCRTRTLSIFKPLPPVESGAGEMAAALESFVAQLDADTEILFAVEEPDRGVWEPVIANWKGKYPAARIESVIHAMRGGLANPKIAKEQELAKLARGDLWMWSDADIIAPPGLLRILRREFGEAEAGLLTCPYVVRRVASSAGLLEALFVNVEFFPGVLLIGRLRAAKFAFGACTVFAGDKFRESVSWQEIGETLADDTALGRAMPPVRISRNVVEMLAQETTGRGALLHYLRWQKTVRWVSPLGFAAQIVLLPCGGWLAFVLCLPASAMGWLGLACMSQFEVLVALAIFCRIGCVVKLDALFGLQLWWLLRPVVWIACWLPWPVIWGRDRRKWWGLQSIAPAHARSGGKSQRPGRAVVPTGIPARGRAQRPPQPSESRNANRERHT